MKKRLLALILAGTLISVSMPERIVGELPNAVSTSEAAVKYSKKKARKKLVKYLKKHKEYKKKYKLVYDHTEGKRYVFHYYEDTVTHTSTVNWYYVNKKTGKIKAMF